MTRPVQIESRVGPDGVLTVTVPLGLEEADVRVRVTVEPLPAANGQPPVDSEWHQFVQETYGSCEGLALERQPQGDYEQREGIE